jgi:hypothetical protein
MEEDTHELGEGKRSHIALKCCWEKNVQLLTHAKASKRKGL